MNFLSIYPLKQELYSNAEHILLSIDGFQHDISHFGSFISMLVVIESVNEEAVWFSRLSIVRSGLKFVFD